MVHNHLEEFVRQFKWALNSRQIFERQKMPRPTSPHRTSRQHLERAVVQRLTIRRPVLAAVDAPGKGVELTPISQGVEPPARPKPRC